MGTTLSKTLIDKAGKYLSTHTDSYSEEHIKYEDVFDEYRKQHLAPLSNTTLELQNWLDQSGIDYYIAQRLKRKPQILRKLKRFSVRLSQLQDIGGSRIIVENNKDVDNTINFLLDKFIQSKDITDVKRTDYREKGREDSGYRAVHLIIEMKNVKIELQIRSKIQHYWAELIERTSVIYGYYIKELQGDPTVIEYFKTLSDLFFEIESGHKIITSHKLHIERLRQKADEIIRLSDKGRIFSSHINESIVKTLIDKEKSYGEAGLKNWIFVFNWTYGSFVSWDVVDKDPNIAILKYVEAERNFPAEEGFEVVLVGSSNVATVRDTHSHYFGLDSREELETLNESILGFSNKMDIDIGAREILSILHKKSYWGSKTIMIETLKNHYCPRILTFDSSIKALIEKKLITTSTVRGVALNVKLRNVIERYL